MELTAQQNRQLQFYRDAFQKYPEYGEAHYIFACHAAFPVVFSVDMLQQLWFNFKSGTLKSTKTYTLPKVVISDFLCSNLCEKVGLGLYEFKDTAIKKALYKDLEQQFDTQHLKRLAAFIYQYAERTYTTPQEENLRNTHQWTALVTINPKEAYQKIADLISKSIKQKDKTEILRIHNLLEELVEEQPILEELYRISNEIIEVETGKNYVPSIRGRNEGDFLIEIKLPKSIINRKLIIEDEKMVLLKNRILSQEYMLKLYNIISPKIAGFILKRGGALIHAQDVTQEAMIAFFSGIKENKFRIKNENQIQSLIVKIAMNIWLKEMRQSKVNLSIDELDMDNEVESYWEEDSIEKELRLTKFENAMSKLSELDRKFIQLRFYEQKNFEEIAIICDVTEGYVRNMFFKTLKKLKEYVKDKNYPNHI